MGACIRSGLPGDGSNCTLPDGTPPLIRSSRSDHHYCPGTCGSLAGAINAITAKNWTVDGRLVSLADIGYASVGIDEGWEGCGQGVDGTQHAADGTPVINTYRLPDMKKLVEYGHNAGVKMGWYQNGCAVSYLRSRPSRFTIRTSLYIDTIDRCDPCLLSRPCTVRRSC